MRVIPVKPGMIVSLSTTVRGKNVSYARRETVAEHITADGAEVAEWQTTKTVIDPTEHKRAIQERGKARGLIVKVCSWGCGTYLCPADRIAELEKAIADAKQLAADFNRTATITQVNVDVLCGRIADNDIAALQAINDSARGVIEDILDGVNKLDSSAIGDAIEKAKQLGGMLTDDAKGRTDAAIQAARKIKADINRALKKAADAGTAAVITIDAEAQERIASARVAFLDFDTPTEPVQVEAAESAVLDMPEPDPVAEESDAEKYISGQIGLRDLVERNAEPADDYDDSVTIPPTMNGAASIAVDGPVMPSFDF